MHSDLISCSQHFLRWKKRQYEQSHFHYYLWKPEVMSFFMGNVVFFPCRAFQRFAGVFESRVWLFVGNTLFWHCFILQIVQNNIFVFPAVYKFLKNETMTTLEINLLWLDFRTSLHWQFWGTYLSGDVPVVTLDLMHTYYGNVTITVVLMYSNLKCSNTSLQQVKIWR